MLSRSDWQGEWLVTRRHPLIWIVAAVVIVFVAFGASNEAPRSEREISEALLRLNLLIPVFVLPFVAGAFAPVFYLREVEHGMSDIFAAYPQTPRDATYDCRDFGSPSFGRTDHVCAAVCKIDGAGSFARLSDLG
jgi:hypothetical protein